MLDTNGFASVGAARFFVNGLDTRTAGVDAVLNWRIPVEGIGKWTFTAAYNYNDQKILAYNHDLGPLASIPGLILFGRVESIRFSDGQPKDKVVLSLDGDLGKIGITARSTRYGKVVAPGAANPISAPTSLTAYGPDDIFLGAKWITDLELRFKPTEFISIAIGADNAFDVYPDRSPFGFNGRYLYARIGIDF